MQVQADVDQSDIGRIAVGQPARFTVDSYPDQEFRGRISQIRLNATVSQNVVTYPVIIEVPNPDEKLRPKMTANVTIDVGSGARRPAHARTPHCASSRIRRQAAPRRRLPAEAAPARRRRPSDVDADRRRRRPRIAPHVSAIARTDRPRPPAAA